MKIASITTGQEFLCIDNSTFVKIIKKLEQKFGKNKNDDWIKSNIYANEYIVFDNKFKDVKEIFIKSKTLFDKLAQKIQNNIIIQKVPENSTGQKYLSHEKLFGHSTKYSTIKKNLLLLEIQRHPYSNDIFKRQYRLFDDISNSLELIYVGNKTLTCKSIGEIQVEINGVWQDPKFKSIFNDSLVICFGEEGKKYFWDKINCYNDDLLPQIDDPLRSILNNIGIKKLPQDEIKETEIPYVEKLIKLGKIDGDCLMKSGKGAVKFGFK